MSLDVYLSIENNLIDKPERIYIRENGVKRAITRREWDRRFPGREPFVAPAEESSRVYERNITHNLNKMAEEAGIYNHLWRPDEIDIELAVQFIEPLKAGLKLLESDPERFKAFNPKNGWGDYDGLVDFVADYLHACETYPNASVSVSR